MFMSLFDGGTVECGIQMAGLPRREREGKAGEKDRSQVIFIVQEKRHDDDAETGEERGKTGRHVKKGENRAQPCPYAGEGTCLVFGFEVD